MDGEDGVGRDAPDAEEEGQYGKKLEAKPCPPATLRMTDLRGIRGTLSPNSRHHQPPPVLPLCRFPRTGCSTVVPYFGKPAQLQTLADHYGLM